MTTKNSGLKVHRRFIAAVIALYCLAMQGSAQVSYEDYFLDQGMRVDLVFSGNDSQAEILFQDIRSEPFWGGNRSNLTDPFNYGEFKLQLRDDRSGTVIWSKGFSNLFSEWQTTAEARQLKRSFSQVLVFPYPRKKIIMELYERDARGLFEKIYQLPVDPESKYINRDRQIPVQVTDIMINGDESEKADIVFIAEGYTAGEMGKFISDAERFSAYLFSRDPFSAYRASFNVRAVQSLSLESGSDMPGKDVWRNTACNSSFYTFGIDRYLTTFDHKSICDYAGQVPYDHIVVLVNSDVYGGGGIYNQYSMSTCDHQYSEMVFIHEFGHGFAGLGDEYFNSEVAYSDFYPLDREPWEPNLTTMVDFDSKWKDLIAPGTPVPTPDEPEYKDRTGVFEGGGYVTRGVYRPAVDCTMRNTATAGEFCEVCKRSIVKMILYYTGQ